MSMLSSTLIKHISSGLNHSIFGESSSYYSITAHLLLAEHESLISNLVCVFVLGSHRQCVCGGRSGIEPR